MKNILFKISVSFCSLIIFLGLLEGGLRLAGYIHSLSRGQEPLLGPVSLIAEKDKDEMKFLEEDYVILAVGDSFTYGGDSLGIEATYPRILERKIVAENFQKKYRVINAGICEYNSKQVLIRLPGWIEKYQPDMVLLLVGATDRLNLAGYSFSEMGIRSLFYNLRLYKMAKIIYLNLKARILNLRRSEVLAEVREGPGKGMDEYPLNPRRHKARNYFKKMAKIDSLPLQPSGLEQAWYHYNNGERKKAIKVCKQALEENPFSPELLANMAFFHYDDEFYQFFDPKDKDSIDSYAGLRKALYYFDKASEIAPESEFLLEQLSAFYVWCVEFYFEEGDYGMIAHYLSKAMRLDPYNNCLYYYILGHVYGFQGKYDARHLLRVFQEVAEKNPELRKNNFFLKHLEFFKNREKVERSIYEQKIKNLNKIIKLCQNHSVEVIVQNYPYSHLAANEILEDLALRHSLLLVDHNSVFNQKLREGADPRDYFEQDEHCTEKGFRIMADNVYNLLEKEGFLE